MINVGPYDGLYAEGLLIAVGMVVVLFNVGYFTPVPIEVAWMLNLGLLLYLMAGVSEVKIKIDEQRESDNND